VDQTQESLKKISAFLQLAPTSKNIFKTLIKIKLDPDADSLLNIQKIKKANKKALSFLANNSINTVPVIIVESSKHERHIFTSSESALAYLFPKNIHEFHP